MNASANRFSDLEAMSLRVREHVIRMSGGGGCFIGASLSCVDLMVYLYKRALNVGPANFSDPNRDYCFLSKGHDVPALYGTFAEMGWIERERLAKHLDPKDSLYWHPNRAIPGVEFHSGSLGHLLPVALGVAYDLKMTGSKAKVVVITGDGELNEGSNWEAMLVAHAHGLDNVFVVVDRNQFQANMRTEDLLPLEPLPAKFEAFGGSVVRVDGHDFAALEKGFEELSGRTTKGPKVLIADTTRGKGLPSIEARADRWFCKFSDDEIKLLMNELHGGAAAGIVKEGLTVR